MALSQVIGGVLAIAISWILYNAILKDTNNLPLPPGPKGLPIIGNIQHLPPPGMPEYIHWAKHKPLYGPISSITVLGQTMVVLQDRQIFHDLLEKQSIKTSMRSDMPFGNGMCGFGKYLPSQQYDETFRLHRKMIHQQMGTDKTASRFSHVQDVESRRFLLRVLDNPKGLLHHLATQASAIVLKITYGYAVEPRNDPLVNLVERMMDNFSQTFVPGTWIVDMIPLARHLPEWFPGTSFHKMAKQASTVNNLVDEVPFSFVKQLMAAGKNRDSYVSSLIELNNEGTSSDVKLDKETENAIKYTAAIMYGAAADTTSSTQSAFILAMVLFPEVQKKAQEEIDRVLGGNALPGLDDRDQLPYVSAVAKEALRWFPIVPINTVHKTSEEIEYSGYRIPKNSFLLISNWSVLHDPEIYADPESFNPERFLGPKPEPDPSIAVFGHGRRICPGRYLADQSMFLTISRLLATFDIIKAVDQNGKEIIPKLEATPGLITHPVDFAFDVRPRSEEHVRRVRAFEVEFPWDKGDSELLGLDEWREAKL